MDDDPIVLETRRIRDELAAKFDYDVDAIFRDLEAKQREAASRVIKRTKEEAERAGPGAASRRKSA